jgi:hypothetical protein
MITADSSLVATEEMSTSETVNRPSLIEEVNLLSLPREELFPEELLTEPNRDVANQTQIGRINGTSSTLDVKSDQLFFFPPSLRPAQEHFRTLQKWEGYVIEVRKDTFLARLTPIVGEGLDQEAEIYLEEIEKDDHALIEPGAVFYWSIGYLDRPSGRSRTSVIRFRRLPVWTKRELKIASTEATKLRDLLDVE